MADGTLAESITDGAIVRGGVSAIVLAAGLSTRMGVLKPLVSLGGRPLLSHVVDGLRQSDATEIVVVLGAQADRVRRHVDLSGTRVVVNPRSQEGMSGSIRCGVRAAAYDAFAFLIVLGDQPFVEPATYNALIARREATGARILVPTWRGSRGNPVLLARSLSAEIEALTGDVGCRGIVKRHAEEVLEVPVDDPGILLDIDTPEDARRVDEALARGSGLDALVSRRPR